MSPPPKSAMLPSSPLHLSWLPEHDQLPGPCIACVLTAVLTAGMWPSGELRCWTTRSWDALEAGMQDARQPCPTLRGRCCASWWETPAEPGPSCSCPTGQSEPLRRDLTRLLGRQQKVSGGRVLMMRQICDQSCQLLVAKSEPWCHLGHECLVHGRRSRQGKALRPMGSWSTGCPQAGIGLVVCIQVSRWG